MRPFITRFRIPLLIAAVFVALLGLGVTVLFTASFQTWAARRALASRADVSGSIGKVSAGLGRVEVQDVRLVRDGAVLTLPAAEIEMPVLAAVFGESVRVSQLKAKGWTLDLSKWKPPVAAVKALAGKAAATATPLLNGTSGKASPVQPPSAADAPGNAVAQPTSGTAPTAAPARFSSVLDQIQVPFDLVLDGVDVSGDVVLPDARGRVRTSMNGGGLAAGRSGKFTFAVEAALSETKVRAAGVRGTVMAEMDTPRSLRGVALSAEATAEGTQFPNGIKLATEAAATRSAEGETYSVGMISEGRQVLAVAASLPRNSALLTGTWKADVRHADLAPFAMGRALPEFSVVGEGRFDTDATFSAIHAAGQANATAADLQVLRPELSAVGAIKVKADFDVGRRGDAVSIRKLEADLSNDGPVARLQALQAFEFNPATAELRAENAERDLFDLVVHGVPSSWLAPFAPDLLISGGDLKGELAATMRAGGTGLRTKTPLTVSGVSIGRSGAPLVNDVAVSLAASADYTPHGWQAEVAELTLRHGDSTLLMLAAKAGQLPGDKQPVKATGQLAADLAAVLTQPVAAGTLALTRGQADVAFTASLGPTKELQAKVAVSKLAAPARVPASAGGTQPAKPVEEQLPTVSADVRADLASDGQLVFNAPILIERDARKSDLTVGGTVNSAKDVRTIEAQLTSENFVVDDAKILAVLVPAGEKAPDPGAPQAKPVWAGIRGTLALRLKKVVYADFQASDVAGTLRIDEGAMQFEGLRMGMGEGDARLDGILSFNRGQPQPYGLDASVALRDVDPGPLLRALQPGQSPTLEGKFDVKSDVTGRAASIEALAPAVAGQFEVTSRGGVFRGLPVNVGNLVESTSKVASWLASAGSALGALTGKRDYSDVTSKAQAVAEFAKGLNPIVFDQLSLVASRDAQRNLTVKDFALISPELRLTGGGQVTHRAGADILDDALSIEFTLRARGRQGDLLKYLGMLEPQPDQLGYSACTLPFKIGGTVGAPDTSELNQRLLAVALEKSGVGDKAAELLQKIRGSKPSGDN